VGCLVLLFLLSSLFFSGFFAKNVLTFLLLHFNGISCLAYCIAVVPLGKEAKQILKEGTECLTNEQKDERLKIVKNLSYALRMMIQGSLQNVILGLIFGYWPWMRQNYMYMSCFQGIIMAYVLTQVISLHQYKPSASRTRQSQTQTQRTRNKTQSVEDSLQSSRKQPLKIPKALITLQEQETFPIRNSNIDSEDKQSEMTPKLEIPPTPSILRPPSETPLEKKGNEIELSHFPFPSTGEPSPSRDSIRTTQNHVFIPPESEEEEGLVWTTIEPETTGTFISLEGVEGKEEGLPSLTDATLIFKEV